jgi:hypothetical protein
MTRLRARVAVLILAIALGSTAVPALAAPAAAAPAPSRSQAAAGWLASQMTGRSHFVDVFQGTTFPSQGLTIDALLAFAATGSADRYGARAITWLKQPHILSGYIGNGKSSSFAGALAKVALAAEVRGMSPHRFGGVNLVARLGKLLQPSGRYSDHSTFGDFSNAFSQSLAIIALRRIGTVPRKAVSFLLSSQCKNGGFPLEFGQKTCSSEPDATAMAVQALLAVGRPRPAQHALRWLASVQKRDGGLVNPAGGAAPNANSTGLAGEAFAAGHWPHRAALARTFLFSLQVGCPARVSRRGAIAYSSAGFSASTAVSATAQGILGLADVSLYHLSSHGASASHQILACSA